MLFGGIGLVTVGCAAFFINAYLTRNNSHDWLLTPKYIPAGVVASPSKPCDSNAIVGDSLTCTFFFDHYPGYLSKESQRQIEATVSSTSAAHTGPYGQPLPFMTLVVTGQAEVLKRYQFDGEHCDITRMREVADTSIRYRTYDAFVHKPQARDCKQAITPKNRLVTYDSPTNQLATEAAVSTDYYTIRNNTLIMLHIGNGPALKTSATAYYLTDPGFQEEVYKFLDSFTAGVGQR